MLNINKNLTLHGANPENLYKIFNLKMPEKIIDFSSNTNVISWPEIDIDLRKSASCYPDINCSKLREFIAYHENISQKKILFTNGINEAIFILSQIFMDNTGIFQPSYSEYFRAFKNLNGTFNINDAGNFKHFIVVNPNNPTGKYVSLRKLIISNPRTIFIIDEAYIDFLIDKNPERLCDLNNVILLRSLTKIFHLSGARIGYIIADENIISELENHKPSWNVNGIAQELALIFLKNKEFIARTKKFYRSNTPEFMRLLRENNFDVMDSDVHYFLIKVEDDLRVIENLLRAGIVVRHTRNFEGINGQYIRIATRTKNENMLLIEKLKS